MIAIAKPDFTAVEVFTECVGTITTEKLRNKLEACVDLIIDSEREFESKITRGQIYTIVSETMIKGNVTASELTDVYTTQLVPKKKPARIFYDQLKLAAPNDLCPFCGHGDVKTIDHYLPKSKFPRLSVVPLNLVPSCLNCNTNKRQISPTADYEETLHPYFDHLEIGVWLKSEIVNTDPISIRFFIEKQTEWDDLLYKRVQHHFEVYELAKLYSLQAARELGSILNKLQKWVVLLPDVKKFLEWEAGSHRSNSWQAALYNGLAEDEWFCEEGFMNSL